MLPSEITLSDTRFEVVHLPCSRGSRYSVDLVVRRIIVRGPLSEGQFRDETPAIVANWPPQVLPVAAVPLMGPTELRVV